MKCKKMNLENKTTDFDYLQKIYVPRKFVHMWYPRLVNHADD